MASNYYPHYDFNNFQIYRTTAVCICPVEEHWQTQKEQPGKCEECGTELIVHEKRELFEYIERYYNCQRLHATLGYVSPMQFEAVAIKNCA